MVNFFIRRPVFAIVCSLLIILAGAVSIPTLPIAQFPTLAPPQVSVSTSYTGANSQAVENSVTTLLEQAINGAEGMRYITSSSGNDGSSSISATFDLQRNIDIAAVDVQNRAATVMGRLPVEVQTNGVVVNKSGGSWVMGYAVYSPDGRYSPLFLSNYLDVYVKDALKRVKGVADVIMFDQNKYAMRIWLDPTRLAKRNLTASDVVAALEEQNVQVAAGAVGQPPAMPGQGYQISVRAIGRLSEAREFEKIVLRHNGDGSLIQLRDVGRTELGSESYGAKLTYNGHEAVGFGVQQLTNANALEVTTGVKREMARLAQRFPPGVAYMIIWDSTEAVDESINEVLKTLIAAIIIVILVIFLFLQTWRSTLIPAITIPVSLIGTFLFVKLFGFSINTLTLFGITLATGLVVDDAIVVIENVERHIQEGIGDPRRATHVAMKEVTGAVVATSLVLIAVFVPVGLFPGTTGRMYQQFALTIAFSIALSAFNALTLSPALAALLLRREEGEKNWVFRTFNRVQKNSTTVYTGFLPSLERARWLVLVGFLAGLGLTLCMYRFVPSSFVPDEDQGWMIAAVQAPEGASLDYTTAVTDHAARVLSSDPDVESVFCVPGMTFSGAAPNRGMMFINLKPYEQRKGSTHSVHRVLRDARRRLANVQEAIVMPFLPAPIEGLGQYGGFQFELQQTGAGSLEELESVLRNFMRDAGDRRELQGLFATYTARDPQLLLDIDREKAKSLGVPFTQISSALQVYMGSQHVNDFDFNNRSYRVYVQADKQFRSQPRDLRQFYVRSDNGQMLPLDTFAGVRETTNAGIIGHYNLFRSAEINGSAAPGFSSGQAIAAMEEAARKTLPFGYSYEWTGLALEEIQSGRQTLLLFALGLLVVYLTLSAQYESFVLPFIILLAVPMAVFGALAAQWLRGLQNDVYCQVGLVMLIGLASKNAILIVEFAEQLQEKGMEVFEAAVEAARLRLRPILMTSVAFMLGVLPLVFATGAGSEGRHSVGTTVFGGMFVSTFLNLFVIPILYVLVRTLLPSSRAKRVAIPQAEG